MATYYFKTGTGEPFTDKSDAGDAAVAIGDAVKVTSAPDNVEAWRMKYNFGTSTVDVFASGKDEAAALVDKLKAIDDTVAAAVSYTHLRAHET